MSVDVTQFLSQPGYLVWNPTDLSAAFPHGSGTDLGATETGVRLRANLGRLVLKAEEAGERILDVVYAETELTLTVVLHQWNNQNVQLAFPGGLTVAGASGNRVVQFPGTLTAGTRMSANAGVLVFSPLDLTNNRVLLARRAIPMAQESAEIAWRLKEPTKLPLVFYLANDESIASTNSRYNSRSVAIGVRTDLTI